MILHSEDLKDERVVISTVPALTHQCVSQETGGSLAAENSAYEQPHCSCCADCGISSRTVSGVSECGIQPPSGKCLISIPNKK